MNNMIINQIEADKHNIQQMLDMLKFTESKGEYRTIVASIKTLVREITYQRKLLLSNISEKPFRHDIPLFEVELPEPEMDELYELTSFFGEIA